MPEEGYVEAITEEEHGGWADAPDVVFDASNIRTIKETNFIDEDAPASARKRELQEGAEDLGDGFLLHDEPVLIQRGPDGGIVKLTPLAEIPGVYFDGEVLKQEGLQTPEVEEAEAMVADAKPTPVPLATAEREKLKHIIATRLYNHYATEASLRNRHRYNPIRDGIPDLPAGAPKFLAPTPEMPLIPATTGQVYQWLLEHVAKRASIVERKRFGKRTLQDFSLRIE